MMDKSCSRNRKADNRYKVKPFMVVHCPKDELGISEYPIGARFSDSEVRYTAKMGYFSNGMIFQSHGKLYKIIGNHVCKMEHSK